MTESSTSMGSRSVSLMERLSSLALTMAFVFFTGANLLHNQFGLDLAIVPPAVLTFLYGWKRKRVLLWAAAIFIGIPSALFFSGKALKDPSQMTYFMNHLALLLAVIFAGVSTALSFFRRSKEVA